jgi:hypothetical protein
VRLAARLSSPAPWSVRILTADGTDVAVLSGSGGVVDATWSGAPDAGRSLPASLVGLRWRIEAGDPATAARPAEGTFGTTTPAPIGTPSVTLEAVRADPAVLSPNGDGLGDGGRVAWRQSARARVRISVVDARGAEVAVPLDLPDVAAGDQSAPWDGLGPGGVPIPSGRYRYRLEILPAAPFGLPVTTTTPVTIRRGAGRLTVSPVLTPNGDGRLERAPIRFDRLEAGPFQVRLWRRGALVRTLADVPGWQGPWELRWDGAGVADGAYLVQLVAPGAGGTLLQRAPILIDRRPPVLTVRRLVRARGRVILRVGLSEGATVKVAGGGRTLASVRRAPGGSSLTLAGRRLRGVRFLYLRPSMPRHAGPPGPRPTLDPPTDRARATTGEGGRCPLGVPAGPAVVAQTSPRARSDEGGAMAMTVGQQILERLADWVCYGYPATGSTASSARSRSSGAGSTSCRSGRRRCRRSRPAPTPSSRGEGASASPPRAPERSTC